MHSTMMDVPLSLNHLLERAGTLFAQQRRSSRACPTSRCARTPTASTTGARARSRAALQSLGLKKGDRVATLCWNHHAHLECYFGIPAAGGVMHTLNLRLAPDEIGWIAATPRTASSSSTTSCCRCTASSPAHARVRAGDRVPVLRRAGRHRAGFVDYEALLAGADADALRVRAARRERPGRACATRRARPGRSKGVVYSHRSTVLHTLVGCLGDHWALQGTDVLLPVTPMFHANCWGLPYGAVMMGAKLVFPGPHLHPDDLLDLMQLEPPTLALGVPTIWIGADPGLRARARRAARRAGSCPRACARWSAARRCPSR